MQQKSKRPVKFAAALALLSTVAVGLSGASALANDSLPSGLVTTKSAAPKPAPKPALTLTRNQQALIQVSTYLQQKAEPGSIVAISYRLSNLDPSLARNYLHHDLSPELKADIEGLRASLVAAKEQALQRNLMLSLQVSQVGQQAAIALVKNGERLTQIDSDLAFLESVENLNGVDHKTQTLTPETIERLSSIEGTETFVIEDGPSILAVLARVQSIELSHNKGVSNVSLLPFKAPIAQEPTPIGFHFPSNVKPRVSCERAFEGS